ncbi:hypothetical protein ACGF7U_17625 [Micromonospora sp. NPDC047670]|uniref:hypothetical protein n=1 Tax=Micromonospora sp. NPDC047670 TaxID=3364252 RepID=UPI00371FF224
MLGAPVTDPAGTVPGNGGSEGERPVLYPCNRCGHMNTTQPSMCCASCYKEIDEEADDWARGQVEAARRHDNVDKGGCAVIALAVVALPTILVAVATMLAA